MPAPPSWGRHIVFEDASPMPDPHPHPVTLLEDTAELWPRVEPEVPADFAPGADGEGKIGIVCWRDAGRAEIAGLPALRAEHPGPIVAVIAAMAEARGA